MFVLQTLLSVAEIATAICTTVPGMVSAENALLYMKHSSDDKLM